MLSHVKFVENCRLGLRCFHAPVTLPLGLYTYSFCNAYLWCEVQMLFSKFTISIILGHPGAVSRADKMFEVKVYRKIDLPVNFHHEHFIDPTNCPWVSQDGYQQCAFSANWQTQQRSTRLQNRQSAFLLSSKTVLQGAKGDLSFDLSLARSSQECFAVQRQGQRLRSQHLGKHACLSPLISILIFLTN